MAKEKIDTLLKGRRVISRPLRLKAGLYSGYESAYKKSIADPEALERRRRSWSGSPPDPGPGMEYPGPSGSRRTCNITHTV